MTSFLADVNATLEMIISGHQELSEIDPKNNLLKFLSNVTPNGFEYTPEYKKEFIETFAKEEHTTKIGMMVNYVFALESELVESYKKELLTSYAALVSANPNHTLLMLMDPKKVVGMSRDNLDAVSHIHECFIKCVPGGFPRHKAIMTYLSELKASTKPL